MFAAMRGGASSLRVTTSVLTGMVKREGREMTEARRESIEDGEDAEPKYDEGGSTRLYASGLRLLARPEPRRGEGARIRAAARRGGEGCLGDDEGETFLATLRGFRIVRAGLPNVDLAKEAFSANAPLPPRPLRGTMVFARVFVTSTRVPKARFGARGTGAEETADFRTALSAGGNADLTRLDGDAANAGDGSEFSSL